MWDVLEEAPVFSDAERLACTNILLTVLHSLPRQVSAYAGLERTDTIIWNHTTFPLMGIYWLSRYFRRFYGNLDGRLELMLSKVSAAFEGQVSSWKPQEDSLGYYSIVPDHTIEYTLAENDCRYFENGSVRRHAEYTVTICDNTGDAAGFGDTGYGHAPYVRNLHWALWGCRDGRFLWWLNKVLPQGYKSPYDPGVKEVEWPELQGVNVFELHRQVYDYTKTKTYYGGPASPPNVAFEKTFDKISFRENLAPNGEYFLLDGYSRGKHLQYDGNAIIKFYADGEDWLIDGDYLVRNTTDHSMVSVIRDGRCEKLVPTCAALEAAGDLPSAGLTQTALYDYNGANWRRSIFWLKGEFVVVLDELEALEAGDYAFVGNWKTLAQGDQALVHGRAFKTSRGGAGHVGHRGLIRRRNPAPGVREALFFSARWSQLDTVLDLPKGQYKLTLYARGTSGGADSFWVRIDGGERIAFHIPIEAFGPSSGSWTKGVPTPNIKLDANGPHRLRVALREGLGPLLDRFVVTDPAGKVVAEVEAEDAPPFSEGQAPAGVRQEFHIKNDGFARNGLAGRINHVGRRIAYLRQRFGGRLAAGARVSLQNVFYNDASDAPKDYDIRRLDRNAVLVLKSGRPFAAFTAGRAPAASAQPDCVLTAVTERAVSFVGVREVPGLFVADKPVAVEIDFDRAAAVIRAPDRPKPLLALGCADGRVAVIDGRARTLAEFATGAEVVLVEQLQPGGRALLAATPERVLCLEF